MKLIITIGDCNGIGLEVAAKALTQHHFTDQKGKAIEFTLAGNPTTIAEYFDKTGVDYRLERKKLYLGNLMIRISECFEPAKVEFGQSSEEASRLAAEALETAFYNTIDGRCEAMVTLPISKESFHKSGWSFPGQTEFLAARCGVTNPLMVLVAGNIRCGLGTIHEPIRRISRVLSQENLQDLGMKFHLSLFKDFGCISPKIAFLALNPHSGEGGDFGSEETDKIIPAIDALHSESVEVDGPFAADGFFAHKNYEKYDGYVAMYHDQGLIPLKIFANGGGVNFTASLPIVRTSPAHGTAYEIAGQNIADPTSFIEAVELAVKIATNRRLVRF